MSYRPITDTWILARSKVKYYGAYPAGFLSRARALLGVGPDDAVLHVCAGRVRDYPYAGVGRADRTLDLDPACQPDFLQDAREPYPTQPTLAPIILPWAAVLADPPYTEGDADKYVPGRLVLPTANEVLKLALDVVNVGSKVGILHYQWPQPPTVMIGKDRLLVAKEVAVITVLTGRNNRARVFTVWEKLR